MSRPNTDEPSIMDVNNKPFSCLTCRQRKVKCDRRNPCSNCVKADSTCSFIAPARGKRKRTKPPPESMHAKLRRYEDILKSYGAKIEPPSDSDESEAEVTPRSVAVTKASEARVENHSATFDLEPAEPKFVNKEGGSRYYDNSLWPNAGFDHPDEFAPIQPIDVSAIPESELFLSSLDQGGSTVGAFTCSNLWSHYPSIQSMTRLKDLYVERFDPLMKVLHIPTFWSAVTNAIQCPERTPKSLEALMFGFCFAAISCLADSECQKVLGGQKAPIYSKYRELARKALINAGFLHTSSLMTLQAFSLFLVGAKGSLFCDTEYILSGVAVRLARRMGLHRDGASLGLSPFETEARRRLWWYIVHVDFRTADLLGSRPSLDIFGGDTKTPLNVPDEDLTPEMKKLPPERKGITSITFCLLRCQVMDFLRELSEPSSVETGWDVLASPDIATTKKDRMIDQVEDRFESKFLRYCDPANSLHTLASVVTRCGICKLRLLAHNPRYFAKTSAKIPQAERDIIFFNSTKLLEYTAFIQQNKALHKYMWRSSMNFMWDTILYALIQARHRRTGPEVERLWELMGVVLSGYPNAFGESTGAIVAALGQWTLEVWDEYVAASKLERCREPVAPEYINTMRQQQISRSKPGSRANIASESSPFDQQTTDQNNIDYINHSSAPAEQERPQTYTFPDLVSFEMDPNEWMQWELLVSEHGGFGQMESI